MNVNVNINIGIYYYPITLVNKLPCTLGLRVEGGIYKRPFFAGMGLSSCPSTIKNKRSLVSVLLAHVLDQYTFMQIYVCVYLYG